ncbi:MAG: glucose-1-phosphate thymidylyltransferase [Armatimonadota bacterium]
MKAVVLCAGEGRRLRPLTFRRPKHLLPVAGKAILQHVLAEIQDAGITEVGLVVGEGAEAIQQFVQHGEQWNINVSYIQQSRPRGIADAVNCARDYVQGEQFLVYLGDNLLESDLNDFTDAFMREGADAALVLKAVDDPERYGVATLDADGHIQQLVEKPAHPASNLAIVGVYAFSPSIFEAIDAIEPSDRGEYEITDAIQHLIDSGARVTSTLLEGFWEDTGEPEKLLRANRRYLQRMDHDVQSEIASDSRIDGRPVSIGTKTRIENATITAPCVIGANCVLRDCKIGPNVSIGAGCRIIESHLRNSVIDSNSRVECLNGGVIDSIVGRDVVIQGSGHSLRPLRVVLGDMARIQVR